MHSSGNGESFCWKISKNQGLICTLMYYVYNSIHARLSHRPYCPSKSQWVRYTTSDVWRSKREAIISHISSRVRAKGTVTSVPISCRSSLSQTKPKSVVTLTVPTQCWIAVSGSIKLTAVATALLMLIIAIVTSIYFQCISTMSDLWREALLNDSITQLDSRAVTSACSAKLLWNCLASKRGIAMYCMMHS